MTKREASSRRSHRKVALCLRACGGDDDDDDDSFDRITVFPVIHISIISRTRRRSLCVLETSFGLLIPFLTSFFLSRSLSLSLSLRLATPSRVFSSHYARTHTHCVASVANDFINDNSAVTTQRCLSTPAITSKPAVPR